MLFRSLKIGSLISNGTILLLRCSASSSSTSSTQPNKQSVPINNERRVVDLNEFDTKRIRNFSIVAHIDHGKSTLADALLEHAGTIEKGVNNAQVLDKLLVERERGITVKAQTATMFHTWNDETYLLNLVDTPGHVDFSYEVSRSLAASDGAVLLVDAQQGVQAQTVANFWLAFAQDLTVMGVLNKIDLPNARPEMVQEQMEKLFEIQSSSILRVSAKMRTGISELMDEIVKCIKPPEGDRQKPLKTFVFDSWYNSYNGCYALVVVKDGVLRKGQEIVSLQTSKKYEVQQVGMFENGIMFPEPKQVDALYAGQVGYFLANIRNVRDIRVGDTFCLATDAQIVQPLPGFKKFKPVVYAGVFPVEPAEYETMKGAVDKLCLNDPSVEAGMESSPALGAGWRFGFLGVLHMEVFIQRLEQEYDANVLLTSPSVTYVAKIRDNPGIRRRYDNKSELIINDPSKFPDPKDIEEFSEPMAICTIITPMDYYRKVESLCDERRGERIDVTMIDNERMIFKYRFPLADIIIDFFNSLKNITSGYASFDYELDDYRPADLVKVDILLNGKCVGEFSVITTRDRARERGKDIVKRLAAELPAQLFEITVQAAIGKKILARENVRPVTKSYVMKLKGNMAKDRLAKLVSRQKEGKKRMKLIGRVEVPKEAFRKVFCRNT